MARPPSCECGTCRKCKAREKAREKYRAMSQEERRAVVESRDPEKVRAADRARYERDKPKRIAAQLAYFETPAGRASRNRANKASDARYPEKRAARIAVSNAIRDGRLKRGACVREGVDCSGRIEAHHPDYARPLDVVWACSKHHDDLDADQRALPLAQDVS